MGGTFNTSTDNIPSSGNDEDIELLNLQWSNCGKNEKSVKNNEFITSDLQLKTDEHSHDVLEVLEVLGPHFNQTEQTDITVQFLKCPHCSFENIHPEEIAHHIEYSHFKSQNVSESDETDAIPCSEVNRFENPRSENE